MADEKRIIPYKVEKGNRPKMESVIENCLDDELRKPALAFANWMREQKMPFKACHTSTTRVRRSDYMKEPICDIYVFHESDWNKIDKRNEGDPQEYGISPWLILFDLYEHKIANEGLDKIKWDRHHVCSNCAVGDCWGKGTDRTALNKQFMNLCWFNKPTVVNPDAKTIDEVKRLLLLEQQAMDEYGKPPRHPKFRK